MAKLRVATAEEYRRAVWTQHSWMQRGDVFVLEMNNVVIHGLRSMPPGEREAFVELREKIAEWRYGKPLESQNEGEKIWYATSDKATAIEFKLMFG